MEEEILKIYGFDSQEEFNQLVSNVDISTPKRLEAFEIWQDHSGTKKSLLKLHQHNERITRKE